MATGDLRKAAVLLMSLPEEEGAKLLSMLNPKQVELVTVEIAKIGTISGDEQQLTIAEFSDSNPDAFGGGPGGLDRAKTLVERARGKNAGGTMENVRQQIEAVP